MNFHRKGAFILLLTHKKRVMVMDEKNSSNTLRTVWLTKQNIIFFSAVLIFICLLYVVYTGDIAWESGAALSILLFSLILWTLEPIPFGMTSILTVVLLIILQVVSLEIVLSGFSSPAVFLVIGGIMMAQGVNNTKLMERLTFYLVSTLGSSPRALFFGLFLLMQVQALFIPAAAVRATLMIPLVLMIIQFVKASESSNFNKLFLVGTAYASNISGMGVLTAGLANILTVEILYLSYGQSISYFQWFLYALPLWGLLSIIIPLLLLKLFPPEQYDYAALKKEMRQKYLALGSLDTAEKKCITILVLAVVLWMSEPLHGLHPVVPALIAVILMTTPLIGFVDWKKIVQINFDLVLLVGATLSLGLALIETNAIELVTDYLMNDWFLVLAAESWIMILLVILLTQLYHLIVTNINTAVITFIPFLIALSLQLGHDPIMIAFVCSVTTLFGFILVVQTLPNILVYGTGLVQPRDFLVPGLLATVISILVTLLVAYTYWHSIDFWP